MGGCGGDSCPMKCPNSKHERKNILHHRHGSHGQPWCLAKRDALKNMKQATPMFAMQMRNVPYNPACN